MNVIGKKLEGSYTLEAAWILFCVFGVITALIFVTFYIHDKAVAEGICRKVAGMGIHQVQENTNMDTGGLEIERLEDKSMLWRLMQKFDDTEQNVLKTAEKELSDRLFLGKNPNIQVELSADKIVLEYQIEWEFPLGIWKVWIPDGIWTLRGNIQVKKMESEELIRLCKGILQ